MEKDKREKYVKVYLTEEEHMKFKIVCINQKKSMTELLRMIIKSWIEKYGG